MSIAHDNRIRELEEQYRALAITVRELDGAINAAMAGLERIVDALEEMKTSVDNLK